MLGTECLGSGRNPSEVEQRSPILLVWFDRIGVRDLEVVELPGKIDLVLRPALLENLDDLTRSRVARLTFHSLSGKVGGNDIHGHAALRDVVDRREMAGQHRRMNLPHPDRDKLIDLLGLRCHRCGKREWLLPHDKS